MARATPKEKTCFACFVVSCVSLLLGFVMLISFGKMYVDSYRKTIDFSQNAECTVQNTTFLGVKECFCSPESGPERCRSHFPCYHVLVSYSLLNATEQTATLYEDMGSFQQRDDTLKCSILRCSSHPATVSDEIEEWLDSHGFGGRQYACAYNPGRPSQVIRDKISRSVVIVSMFAATALFVAGVLFACVFSRYRSKKARAERALIVLRASESETENYDIEG